MPLAMMMICRKFFSQTSNSSSSGSRQAKTQLFANPVTPPPFILSSFFSFLPMCLVHHIMTLKYPRWGKYGAPPNPLRIQLWLPHKRLSSRNWERTDWRKLIFNSIHPFFFALLWNIENMMSNCRQQSQSMMPWASSPLTVSPTPTSSNLLSISTMSVRPS